VTVRRIAILVVATLGLGSGVGFAATLSVGSWHLWAGSQTLTKGTCTATSVTDTMVAQASPNTNLGALATMQVKPDAGSQQWTFVRFDLSACSLPTTAGADKATLKLVVKTVPTGGRTLTVMPVSSSWVSSLSWNGAQSFGFGATTTTFATGTTNGATLNIPVTIDVDAVIKNPSASYGWRITDGGSAASGDTTIFNSNEATAGLRPQLVINYAK
jgi:hypothetical protein